MMLKLSNYISITRKLQNILEQERLFALEHLEDPYWSSENTNVGNDELIAIDLIKTLEYESYNLSSMDHFFYNLIDDIVNLKKTYDLTYEDFDGYGTAIFNSVINQLVNYAKTLDIYISNNPLRTYIETREIHYELDQKIDLSLSIIKLLIYEHKYTYTLDFIQINLFLLSLKLYKSLNQISNSEIIFFTKRFYFLRTILIQILIELEPFTSSHIKNAIYRYVISCSNILDFIKSLSLHSSSFNKKILDEYTLGIENTSLIWQNEIKEFLDDIMFVKSKCAVSIYEKGRLESHMELVNEVYQSALRSTINIQHNIKLTENKNTFLPFTTFALSYSNANKVREKDSDFEAEDLSNKNRIDLIAFQLLASIENLSDTSFVSFLHEMFEETLSLTQSLDNSTFINYMTFNNYNFIDPDESLSWEESKILYMEKIDITNSEELEKRKEVVRFIIRKIDNTITIHINSLGEYKNIEYLTKSILDGANHSINFEFNTIKMELMNDLSKLSNILLVNYYGNSNIFERESTSSTNKLIFISEEILSLTPFSALIDKNSQYLIENFEILNFKNFKSIKNYKPLNEEDFNKGAIIANPYFTYEGFKEEDIINDTFSNLKYSELEANILSNQYNWTTYTKNTASIKNFIISLETASILHIASHAIFQGDIVQKDFSNIKYFSDFFDEIQKKSSIVFAGANHKSFQETSYMTIEDIYKLKYVQTKLIYLSLCMGNMGSIIEGEASLSIAKALLQKGVKVIIASIFQVEDSIAKEISIDFYKELSNGFTPEYSLRKAQLSLLSRDKPFPVWAGFQTLL